MIVIVPDDDAVGVVSVDVETVNPACGYDPAVALIPVNCTVTDAATPAEHVGSN